MKAILMITFIFGWFVATSQDLYIKEGMVVTSKGTVIVVRQNWVNNGGYQSKGGTVVLSGNGRLIDGAVNSTFDTLIIAGDSVILNTDISVQEKLEVSRGKLVIGKNMLQLGGVTSGNGVLSGSDSSSLQITGSIGDIDLRFDSSRNGTSNILKNLLIERTGGTIKLLGNLFLRGELRPSSGTLETNGLLTLVSDSFSTARVTDASGFQFRGGVTVNRFIPAKLTRKWSFISTAVSDSYIRQGWQQQIFVTGNGSGGVVCNTAHANGFDASGSNSPSVYIYDQTTAAKWISIPGTNIQYEPGRGYRVLVRGNRNDLNACVDQLASINPPPPSAVVLSATGKINTGNISTKVYGGSKGYTLLGNPYPCEIDFDVLQADNPDIITNKYWTYDPASYGTNYLTYSNGVVVGCPSGIIRCWDENDCNGNIIASGQAFLVQRDNASDATLVFKESHKALKKQQGVFRSNRWRHLLRIDLTMENQVFIDNIAIRFSDDPSVSITENTFDALTLNSGNLLASMKGVRSYAIQSRPMPTTFDTIPLRVVVSSTGTYRLTFSDVANFDGISGVQLYDAFSGTVTDLRLSSSVNFLVNSSPLSQGSGRFKLIFSPGILPVNFLSISAEKKPMHVRVVWHVASDNEVMRYEIERSEDGKNFHTIGAVDRGISQADYFFDDKSNRPETVYYRVKSVSAGSVVRYSKIVQVNERINDLLISPNPAQDKIQLQMPMYIGSGVLMIYDLKGKRINTQSWTNSRAITISVGHLSPGMYVVKFIGVNGEAFSSKFLKQ